MNACKYCKQGSRTEAHTFGKNDKCTVCGYQKKDVVTVTFHANGGAGRMDPQKLTWTRPVS